MSQKRTIYKPAHEEPGDFNLDFILLPYGTYYEKTACFLRARPGDTLRFFNGPDRPISRVCLISDPALCECMCRMRYGVSWDAAFRKWLSYAMMEGNGRNILIKNKCIAVFYEKN